MHVQLHLPGDPQLRDATTTIMFVLLWSHSLTPASQFSVKLIFFYTTQDEEEKAEIGKLIEQLREDTDNGDNDIPQTEPDLSWLSGTNVDQIAVSGVAQSVAVLYFVKIQ